MSPSWISVKFISTSSIVVAPFSTGKWPYFPRMCCKAFPICSSGMFIVRFATFKPSLRSIRKGKNAIYKKCIFSGFQFISACHTSCLHPPQVNGQFFLQCVIPQSLTCNSDMLLSSLVASSPFCEPSGRARLFSTRNISFLDFNRSHEHVIRCGCVLHR